jgi:hypothetical protein
MSAAGRVTEAGEAVFCAKGFRFLFNVRFIQYSNITLRGFRRQMPLCLSTILCQ